MDMDMYIHIYIYTLSSLKRILILFIEIIISVSFEEIFFLCKAGSFSLLQHRIKS